MRRTIVITILAAMAAACAAGPAAADGPVYRSNDGVTTQVYADPPINGDPNDPPPPPLCYYNGVENNYDGPCAQIPH